MNGAVCGYTNILYPSVKLGAMNPSSIIFWETDETVPTDFNDGANYPSEGVSRRHDQGGIYGAADGSVGFIKFVDWYAEEADLRTFGGLAAGDGGLGTGFCGWCSTKNLGSFAESTGRIQLFHEFRRIFIKLPG